ncbi:MAG: hypothetical protein J0L93_07435 [Deltaproteobacteria bacterium]|nr:hypothetical protein [Deltaproteobacteria bacterium]
MRALWLIAGIACANLFLNELRAQDLPTSSGQRLRLRDLYDQNKQNQNIVDFKISNGEKINILPSPQFLLDARKKNSEQEVKIYFQNRKGVRTEIISSTPEETLKKLNALVQLERPDLITMEGDQIILSSYQPERHLDYSVLNSWIIQPLLLTEMIRGLTWNKSTPGRARTFLANNCKPVLSALSTYRNPLLVAETAAALGSQFIAPHYLEEHENKIAFSDKHRLLTDQFQIWNKPAIQSASSPLGQDQKVSMLPKMTSYFQDLQWILSPDLSEQLEKSKEKRARVLLKIKTKKNQDQQLIDQMANLSRLDLSEKEKKNIQIQFSELKKNIEDFHERTKEIDFKSSQQLKDFYYYYLYKNEWDEIINAILADLSTPQKDKPLAFPSRREGLLDGVEKNIKGSVYLNRKPREAYLEFEKNLKMPVNPFDAKVLELGFIENLPQNLRETYRDRAAELRSEIYLLQKNKLQEFSSLQLDRLRSLWFFEYESIIADGELSRLKDLQEPLRNPRD